MLLNSILSTPLFSAINTLIDTDSISRLLDVVDEISLFTSCLQSSWKRKKSLEMLFTSSSALLKCYGNRNDDDSLRLFHSSCAWILFFFLSLPLCLFHSFPVQLTLSPGVEFLLINASSVQVAHAHSTNVVMSSVSRTWISRWTCSHVLKLHVSPASSSNLTYKLHADLLTTCPLMMHPQHFALCHT